MPLYHKDIFIPDSIRRRLPKGIYMLTYSRHAQNESRRDRYGHVDLPAYVDTANAEVIEVEVVDGWITKILYRMRLDNHRDICIAVIPRRWFVKTVWVNERNDVHRTLDPFRYQQC